MHDVVVLTLPVDGLEDLSPPLEAPVPLPPSIRKTLPKVPTDEVATCAYLTANGTLVACTVDGKQLTLMSRRGHSNGR